MGQLFIWRFFILSLATDGEKGFPAMKDLSLGICVALELIRDGLGLMSFVNESAKWNTQF